MRRTTLTTVLTTFLAVAAAGPEGASAQNGQSVDSTAPGHVATGDRHHEALRPLDALEAYRRALESNANHYPALWKAAREAVTLGMLAGDEDRQGERFAEARELARRAVEVRPDAVEGRQWLAIALGRLAMTQGPLSRARTGRRVQEAAANTLELDSLNAGAHHVLGQWHAEVKRLGGVSRFMAENVLGSEEMDEASWDEAVAHLERAVELAPGGLVHRLELARVYLDLEQPERAREQLLEILERPSVDATDPLLKQRAQELLKELG